MIIYYQREKKARRRERSKVDHAKRRKAGKRSVESVDGVDRR